MGEAASCQTCGCDDQDRTAIRPKIHLTKLAFDAGHEEFVDGQDMCTPWDSLHQSKTAIQCESPREELPSLLQGPKQRKTYKDERMLQFRVGRTADTGLHLVETTPTWPRTSLALLVVRNVEANSPFALDVDGGIGLVAGDALIEVNGCRGSVQDLKEAFEQLSTDYDGRIITLMVRPRPLAFNVSLQQDGSSPKRLGIAAVIDKARPSCVRVQAVHEQGLIPSWNGSHPLLCVCTGDLVTEVNGISGDAIAMCKEIQTQTNCSSGSLIFHIATKANRGNPNCPDALQHSSKACTNAPPWRSLMQSLEDGPNSSPIRTPKSANAKNIWDSSLQPRQYANPGSSRFSL